MNSIVVNNHKKFSGNWFCGIINIKKYKNEAFTNNIITMYFDFFL